MQTGSPHVLSACSGTGKAARLELHWDGGSQRAQSPQRADLEQLSPRNQGTAGLPSDRFPGPSVMILTSFQLPTSCLSFTTAILFFFLLEMFILAQLNRTQWKFPNQVRQRFLQSATPWINEPSRNEVPSNKDTIKHKVPQKPHTAPKCLSPSYNQLTTGCARCALGRQLRGRQAQPFLAAERREEKRYVGIWKKDYSRQREQPNANVLRQQYA